MDFTTADFGQTDDKVVGKVTTPGILRDRVEVSALSQLLEHCGEHL